MDEKNGVDEEVSEIGVLGAVKTQKHAKLIGV